eukprot:scaffold8362_cov165-Amphora_coffeaeformis.AAC.1
MDGVDDTLGDGELGDTAPHQDLTGLQTVDLVSALRIVERAEIDAIHSPGQLSIGRVVLLVSNHVGECRNGALSVVINCAVMEDSSGTVVSGDAPLGWKEIELACDLHHDVLEHGAR